MSKRSLRLIGFCLLFLFPRIIFAEEAPKRQFAPRSTDKAPAEQGPPPNEVVVEDFEDGDLKNLLEGDSGAWNLNPDDETAECVPQVVDMEGPSGSLKSLKLTYDVESTLPAQNGYWTKLKNFDASYYDHLEFDVKGDPEAGFTEVFTVEVKKYKDVARIEKIAGRARVKLTPEWQTISIPLNKLTGIFDFADPETWKDSSKTFKNLDEFVVVFNDRLVTQKTGVVYLDNIRFMKTGDKGPTPVDFPPRHIEKTPGQKLEGVEFAKFLIKRLKGFPKENGVKKKFPKDDREFLMEIARDTWRFFDEVVDQEHGLVLDTIQMGKEKPVDEGTWIGDYTNVTNVGLYFMAVVSAVDLGFITKEDALARLEKTLKTVENWEIHKPSGFPFNYYDTTTVERTSHFISLVDSGWLATGIYVAKNAFPDAPIAARMQALLDQWDFSFFYDPVERQMWHGFYDHLEVYSDYHYGPLYSEPRAISYMAIARGEAPREHWFLGLVRTFPDTYTWQAQEPKNRVERTTLGFTYPGGYYEWKDLKYVPCWGGSAFEALMPTLVLDEKNLAPKGLGLNDKRHAIGQMRYALEELGYPVWGMSPSSVPEGGYSEFGSKPFGSKGYKAGVVTPHASVLALELAPKEVVANLRKLIELYDVYGEYGFYDAVTVKTGLVARKYLALDQGMIFIAINNYLNDGAIRKRFHAEPAMKAAEEILSAEDFGIEDSTQNAA